MYQGPSPLFYLLWFLFMVVAYVYIALCLQRMAQKTNTENTWMAWIPILNIYLLVTIAGKPGWWFILLLIPLVNIIVAIMLWMAVAERCGKQSWLGILIIVPLINLVIPGYLAFSE